MVISEGDDGLVTVLGQMLKPDEIARLLMIAANALTHADEQRTIARIEVHQQPDSVGDVVGTTVPEAKRGITQNADGVLVPPKGETLTSCGACHHPRWYIAVHKDDNKPARFACAHCRNEVIIHRIYHPEGRA